MSASMLHAVLGADIAPCAAKCVALVMAWHCNADTGHAWPSMGTLARECSMSERHAKRAVAALKKAGVLLVVKASAGGAHRSTTIYAFNGDRLAALTDPGRGRTGSAAEEAASVASLRCHPRTGDTGAPRARVTPHGGRPRPSPRASASPKRNEREKTESSLLSSKTAPAGQAAVGRPSLAANLYRPTPTHQPTSQQPLLRKAVLRPDGMPLWLSTREGIESMGLSLGIGSFREEAEPAGEVKSPWGRYTIRVMTAAGLVKTSTRKPAKRGVE